MKYDLSGKVDIFVQSKKGYWYGLQLRVSTKNSDFFYRKKPFRNAIEIPGLNRVIDMPLSLDKAKTIPTKKNDIKVYSEKDVKWLMSVIKEMENNMDNTE